MAEPLPPPRVSRFSFWHIVRTLLADLFYLPRWQQTVLSLGILAGGAGFFATSSSWFSRAGISLVIGFLVGWLFRTFTKIMAMIAAAFAAVVGGLSYCHVISADATAAATQEYHTASSWLTDHADKWKKAGLAHVPSTGSAAFGLFLGVRKKRRVI